MVMFKLKSVNAYDLVLFCPSSPDNFVFKGENKILNIYLSITYSRVPFYLFTYLFVSFIYLFWGKGGGSIPIFILLSIFHDPSNLTISVLASSCST